MDSPPEPLERAANIDLAGRRTEVWGRRIGLLLFTALVAVALANIFGQRPSTSSASSNAATLELHAPNALRSGLIYEARFRIDARRTLGSPQLVLDPGWFDGMTLNSIQPEPVEQSGLDGRIVYTYDTLAAGESLTVRLQYQVNPTAVGARTQNVALRDGGKPVTRIDREIVVYP